MVAIVFEVSGAGKTTLGRLLAQELRWRFYEADDFHSPANIKKMGSAVPLTDEDRWPWLTSLRELIERCLTTNQSIVLACSALKESYRRYLPVSGEVKFVFLRGDDALIADQLRHRRGHFMNPALLQSQSDDLEEPQPTEDAIVIELGRSPRELVKEIKEAMTPF
jgi:gluconokinase